MNIVKCGGCGTTLEEELPATEAAHSPCSKCGSRTRRVEIAVSDEGKANEASSARTTINADDHATVSEPESSTYHEENVAGAYLSQAIDALMGSGNPARLFGRARPSTTQEILLDLIGARSKRIEFARTSILFAALAAEAYINKFLDVHFGGRDLEALDRLPTPDKYVIASQLVTGVRTFDHGTQPLQTIDRLFRLRSRLVHPKPRKIKVQGFQLDAPAFEDFNPRAAAQFIVAVAEGAVTLGGLTPDDEVDSTARWVAQHRGVLLEVGEGAMGAPKRPISLSPPSLPPVPRTTTESEEPEIAE